MSFWGGRKQEETPQAQQSNLASSSSLSSSRQRTGFDSVLGANVTLKGELKSQGNVRMDGTFEGTLEIDGNVLVGETAKITADVHAKNVSIAGAVRGNVSGKKVEILRTGRVWGDITATAISTEEGCFIDGKITMVTHEAAKTFDQSAFPIPDIPTFDESLASTPETPEPADTTSSTIADNTPVETKDA